MTFKQKLANYVLGNFTAKDLPDIAMTGINEGLESESLLILAGFLKNENGHEILSYVKKALFELNIELENKKEAAIEMLAYYSTEILESRLGIFQGLHIIYESVLNNSYSSSESTFLPTDNLDFDKFSELYWEIEMCLDDAYIFENRKDLILETEEKISKELKNWLATKDDLLK